MIIGSPEWVEVHLAVKRQSDDPAVVSQTTMEYLTDRVWRRIVELHQMGRLRYARRRGERAASRGGLARGIELPEVWAECDVVNRALAELKTVWPAGWQVVRRSLRGETRVSETRMLAKAKRYLANAIVCVSRVDSFSTGKVR